MRTKLCIEINQRNDTLDEVMKMIASHNEGVVSIDLEVVECFLIAKKAIFPNLFKGLSPVHNVKDNILEVMEGDTVAYVVSVKEMYELNESLLLSEENQN